MSDSLGCRQLDRCETLNFPGNGLSSAEEFSWTAAQESTVYRHPSRDGGGGWQCHRSSGKIDPCLQAESQLAKGSWISRSGHSLKFGNDNCIPHSVITRLHGTPSNISKLHTAFKMVPSHPLAVSLSLAKGPPPRRSYRRETGIRAF